MTLDESIAYYGSAYALAKILRITPQNISYWKRKNGLIPEIHQNRLERITNGQLKAAEHRIKQIKDRRHNPFMIACPHCKQPIDLDEKHKRLTKKDFKPLGHDHGD